LTPRELEVLALLSEGLPNKLICRRLNIAAGTVKVHIGCIFQELGVRSRLEAVVTARRLGIVGEAQAGAARGVETGVPGRPPRALRPPGDGAFHEVSALP